MTGLAPAYLPSPTHGVWWIGPLPIRAYALCILAGIIAAIWICGRRLENRGYQREDALTVAWWAVPFGIVGGRLYHVITTWQPYWGKDGHPLDALKIWNGGLGIWGAIALGALGAWIGCRRHNISFLKYADAAAPGLALAQAMGRWGNYFNNELHGRATDLPWKLKVYQWDESAGHAVYDSAGHPIVAGYFQPTFLYESIWCLLIALVVVWADRRYHLRSGRSFALYVMAYPIGRIVMELMRDDPANRVLGQRVNVWVCLLIFALGAALWAHFRHNDRWGVADGEPEPVEEPLAPSEPEPSSNVDSTD